LSDWIKNGGKLIAMSTALSTFEGKKGFGLEKMEVEKDSVKNNLISYAEREKERTKDNITGAVFNIKVDNTHPLAFGYADSYATLKPVPQPINTLRMDLMLVILKILQNA